MSDIDVLARTLWGESRNQPFEGQVAVAYVIITRSEERQQSITDICLAPFQFSCWNQNDPNRNLLLHASFDNPYFMVSFGIAALVITRRLENPAPGANHYFTVKPPVSTIGVALNWPPAWAKGMQLVKVIGAHEFLKG